MNKREIFVIPNEQNLLIPNNFHYDYSFEKNHSKMFFDYCNKFDIKVSFNKNELSQICALELAALGHFAVIAENEFILFVPNEVSFNQLKWIKDNYHLLECCDIYGFVYDDGAVITFDKDLDENINPLKEIYSIMRKKYEKIKEGENKCTKN